MDHSMHKANSDMNKSMPMAMNHSSMSMSMTMVFNVDMPFKLLFSAFNIDSAGKLIGAFIGCFIISFIYEGLKSFRETAFAQAAFSNPQPSVVSKSLPVPRVSDVPGSAVIQEDITRPRPYATRFHFFSKPHIIQTALHFVQTSLSYIIMLIVMTYNVYLCLAVVLGITTGYFIFGRRKFVLLQQGDCCE